MGASGTRVVRVTDAAYRWITEEAEAEDRSFARTVDRLIAEVSSARAEANGVWQPTPRPRGGCRHQLVLNGYCADCGLAA